MSAVHGPTHRWFAWKVVDTRDRGKRWLRFVYRRRVWDDCDGERDIRYWAYAVERDSV